MRNKEIISEIKRLQEIMGVEKSKPLLFENPILGKLLGLISPNATKLFPKIAKNYPELAKPLSDLTDKTLSKAQKVKSADEVYRIATSKGISEITSNFDKVILDTVTSTTTKNKKIIENALTNGKTKDEIYNAFYGKTTGSVGDLEKAFKKSFFESVDEIGEKMVKSSPSPKVSPKPKKTRVTSDDDVVGKPKSDGVNAGKVTPESATKNMDELNDVADSIDGLLSKETKEAIDNVKSIVSNHPQFNKPRLNAKLRLMKSNADVVIENIKKLSEIVDDPKILASEKNKLIEEIRVGLDNLNRKNKIFTFDLSSSLSNVANTFKKGSQEQKNILKVLNDINSKIASEVSSSQVSKSFTIADRFGLTNASVFWDAFKNSFKSTNPLIVKIGLNKGESLIGKGVGSTPGVGFWKSPLWKSITKSRRGYPVGSNIKKGGEYYEIVQKSGKTSAWVSYLSELVLRFLYYNVLLSISETIYDMIDFGRKNPDFKKSVRFCVANPNDEICKDLLSDYKGKWYYDYVVATNKDPNAGAENFLRATISNFMEKFSLERRMDTSAWHNFIPNRLVSGLVQGYKALDLFGSDKEVNEVVKSIEDESTKLKEKVEEDLKEKVTTTTTTIKPRSMDF